MRGAWWERSQSLRVRDTRAVFTSLFYEGLSLGSVARESLDSHAGGAWPERGQLTHVHVVRALYYMLYVTDVPFHRQRRNQWEGRSHGASILNCYVMNIEYFFLFFIFLFFFLSFISLSKPTMNELENVTAQYRFGAYFLTKVSKQLIKNSFFFFKSLRLTI